jgi:heme-degrading monooxygenase HmoA
MYMLREVYTAQRGKAPEVVQAFRMLDQALEQAGGYTNPRIYVDYAGPMDTVVYQFEMESLDAYLSWERAAFDNPQAKPLIDALNTHARSGYKELYEVVQ